MAKVVFALGIVVGLAILAIAATAEPQSLLGRKVDVLSGEARAASVTKGSCSLREVALDEGYGVTRKIVRRVCHFDD